MHKTALSWSEKAFYAISNVFLCILSLVILLPLLNVLSQSLSSPDMVLAGRVLLLPKEFTLSTYRMVLRSSSIMTGFFNTLFYAGAGTLVNLIMTVLCAYPLSRKELWGRGAITFLFAFTMMFGGGMIPTYLLIKNLGLIDNRLVMILPNAIVIWNMVIARTFFQSSIPNELYESANLDGASDARTLLSIVLPLSQPILAVLVLFYAVGHWNSYFDAMMYLNSPRLFNIQLVLRNAIANISSMMDARGDMTDLLKTMSVQEAAKYVIIVVAMLPVLILYPFVQKHFVKGIMIGSLKG